MNPHKETGETKVLEEFDRVFLEVMYRDYGYSEERATLKVFLAQALKDAREEAYQAGIRRALEITERVQSDPPSTSFEATEAFIGACDEIEFALDAELHGNK